MNRRNFIRGLLAAGASFTILPGAGRKWVNQSGVWIINPDYVNAPIEIGFTFFRVPGGHAPVILDPPARYAANNGVFTQVARMIKVAPDDPRLLGSGHESNHVANPRRIHMYRRDGDRWSLATFTKPAPSCVDQAGA